MFTKRSLPAPLFKNTAKGGSKIAMMIWTILFIIFLHQLTFNSIASLLTSAPKARPKQRCRKPTIIIKGRHIAGNSPNISSKVYLQSRTDL